MNFLIFESFEIKFIVINYWLSQIWNIGFLITTKGHTRPNMVRFPNTVLQKTAVRTFETERVFPKTVVQNQIPAQIPKIARH